MKWFKKWSIVRSESQNKEREPKRSLKKVVENSKICDHQDSIKCNDNSIISNVSCSKDNTNDEPSCSGIKLHDPKVEVLHPDEFFQDPDHIRQYKEEAEFLNMISEWEIINFTDIPASYYHLNTRQACQKQVKKKSKKSDSDEKQNRTRSSPSTSSASDCPLILPTTPKVMKDIKPVGILTKSKDEEVYASNEDFVQIKRTPSVLSLTSYDEDQYGLFESPYTIPEDQPPEAIYPGFLWDDIQPGLKIKSSNTFVPNVQTNLLLFEASIIDSLQIGEDHRQKTEDQSDPKHSMTKLDLRNIKKDIEDDKSSTINAISRSLMGALMTHNSIISNIKTNNIFTEDNNRHNDDDSDTSSSVNDTKNFCKTFSYNNYKKTTIHDINIEKLFSLNDDGDILINMNHIIIENGCGFLMRRCKNVYKIIKTGIEIDENYKHKRSLAEFFKYLIKLLRNVLFGHPRNKTQSGGPGDSVGSYTLLLANDRTSTFSRNIENFIACTKESREAAPQVVMRNMRQFMSGMKNYLVKHGEGDFQQEVQKARSRLKSDEFLNLDAILEAVMHQLVVLPLREHLYGMFVDYYTRSGDIQLLVENVKYACARNPADFGIQPSVTPPTSMALHQISLLLLRLQEAELPLEKLELFLLVISAIFDATGCPRGQQLGADDFLPILVFVVAKCGFVGAEIEAEFMWGLLQPPLLSGEAGYYLTALCSAVHVLKSFMASDNEGMGSLDWRSSSLPACSSVLRVIIPDECNGSLQTRTLPVRPHTTTREVCRIIAHRARITNPQDYGLFKLVDGEETLLADSECPQDARIAARGKHCMLAYKRIDAKIAWPTSTTASYS